MKKLSKRPKFSVNTIEIPGYRAIVNNVGIHPDDENDKDVREELEIVTNRLSDCWNALHDVNNINDFRTSLKQLKIKILSIEQEIRQIAEGIYLNPRELLIKQADNLREALNNLKENHE